MGAAAIKLNRKFAGIDIDPAAIDTAGERLFEMGKKIVWPSFCSNPSPEPKEAEGGQKVAAASKTTTQEGLN